MTNEAVAASFCRFHTIGPLAIRLSVVAAFAANNARSWPIKGKSPNRTSERFFPLPPATEHVPVLIHPGFGSI